MGSSAKKVSGIFSVYTMIKEPKDTVKVYNTSQPLFCTRNTNRIQTEYKPRRSGGLYDGLYFPGQNKGWHVLYLCRSCVETSPHSTHTCLTRPQICISQPRYTGACIRVLAQHWLSVTVHAVSVVPVCTCLGTRVILELAL